MADLPEDEAGNPKLGDFTTFTAVFEVITFPGIKLLLAEYSSSLRVSLLRDRLPLSASDLFPWLHLSFC
jgi:hypothetical protein